MIRTYSKAVRFKEGDGFLHGFSTGLVKVKSKFRTARGNVLTSKINFLLDSQWTEYMPIMVWVVDHPEGVFVIDTGEKAKVNDSGYFRQEGILLNYINTKSFHFDVTEEEEVGPQLRKLGYREENIRGLVLTHLHLDHFDGLRYFENTDILVHQLEWDKPSFTLPSLYPQWFSPRSISLNTSANSHFKKSISLLESGELLLVHTPGHTLGHCSILLKTHDLHYLLAGDVTYNQYQLENEIHAGGHQSFKHAAQTYRMIKSYAHKHRLVYLPSHDQASLERIKNDKYLVL